MIKIVLLALFLIGIAFVGLAFNIIFRKKRFPESHVGHNKEMKKRKIVCAKTMDKMEQAKVKKELRLKKLRYVKE